MTRNSLAALPPAPAFLPLANPAGALGAEPYKQEDGLPMIVILSPHHSEMQYNTRSSSIENYDW
jgi:hypothetical protein